ncbi:MAG: type II toxin-antitoxin system death-on-curing family toxin [Bacteriovoracaceae bacterium]|nr:type II toxin-antitoxin system death-on-curing family toxin [Bacteriovoracaceae bacterium]
MSSIPKFLTYEQILILHKLQIEEFGGIHGVKDQGLLMSALSQPESGMGDEYFHKDLFEMAAAYLFHLVKNHAFNDGNKRIAALAAAVFLEINGYQVIADEDEFEKLVLDAAQSRVDKKGITDFFRSNSEIIS